MSVQALLSLPYEEILGWQEYFARRPPGWREDNRSAMQVMSMAGSKVKPEDLFESLRVMKLAQAKEAQASVGARFFEKFKGQMTEDWSHLTGK